MQVLSWSSRADGMKMPDELAPAEEALFTGDKWVWVLIFVFVTDDFFCIFR